ncbi:hypothetical protein G0U57_003100 [Chelydra serpentina]|uniref:Uncharacterized protein n=1 Tax=Chelydra serpentina TaxID=8475 RepID=A0A8T1TD12_CHESE|nr:hypothetical protein G0U57_003100 [Chelydra serpentina]
MRRCLTFYLERTKPFCPSYRLFVSYVDRMKGQPVFAQTISK